MSSPENRSRKTKAKNISTYCRIKPCDDSSAEIDHQVDHSYETGVNARQIIQFTRPTNSYFSSSPSGRKSQQYTFNQVFLEDASQSSIFETVGKDVIDNALSGFNGTIFAYGQTGTGKSYTIMGEEFEYDDTDSWGLVPRALNYIFDKLKEREQEFEVLISFLEIYKENMFDLLTAESFLYDKRLIVQKKKVTCKMDDDGVRLEGLCLQKVNDPNEAMEIFLDGYENREVAETYANDRSSRSHAIFTVYIRIEDDTGTLLSKLNFVDLAGSERVSKDKLNGDLAAEAKEINRSLLFLHKVIKSISSGTKPETFRNTMITKILRDSLIGNSMTSLISTISVEEQNFEETLATCDFAHSVSKIKTKPRKNKTEDINRILETVRQENIELKRRIAELEEQQQNKSPSPDQEDMKKLIIEYYKDDNPDSTLQIREDDETSQFCFRTLKEIAKNDNENNAVKATPLTEEEKRDLDSRLRRFIGENGTEFTTRDNPREAQYCIQSMKQIIKEMDEQPKKKGCC